jgi:hypothetical protein
MQQIAQAQSPAHSLNWRHSTRIDIDVRVDLDTADGQTGGLEEQTSAGGDNALANTGNDTCA